MVNRHWCLVPTPNQVTQNLWGGCWASVNIGTPHVIVCAARVGNHGLWQHNTHTSSGISPQGHRMEQQDLQGPVSKKCVRYVLKRNANSWLAFILIQKCCIWLTIKYCWWSAKACHVSPGTLLHPSTSPGFPIWEALTYFKRFYNFLLTNTHTHTQSTQKYTAQWIFTNWTHSCYQQPDKKSPAPSCCFPDTHPLTGRITPLLIHCRLA